MSPNKARLLVVCLAALAALAFASRARSHAQEGARVAQTKEEKVEEKSVIYGRAVYDETGRPVRRARVRLQSPNVISPDPATYVQPRAALTNANGEFRVENVRAGSYLIYVDAPGLLTPASFTDYDGSSGNEDLDSLYKNFAEVTVDGKGNKEVAVRARLGAAIGGKVTYSDGDPVPGAMVSVLRRRAGRNVRLGGGGRGQSSVTSTDERGRFRVSALPPGDYLVVVSELVAHGGDSSGERATASPLVLTYHPSETKANKAAVVAVEAGDEREGVDITIVERETHTISGVVRGRRDGRPIENATVSFNSPDAEAAGFANPYGGYAYGPNSTSTDEQGRWHFDDMPDGEYTIEVAPPREDEPVYDEGEGMDEEDPEATPTPVPVPTPPKKNYAPARRKLTVAGSDLSEVVFMLGDAGRIKGRLIMEGGGQLSESKYVMAVQGEGQEERPPYFLASLSDDDEFTIEGVPPGKYIIYANFYSAEKSDLFIKSVTLRGRDLMREQLEIREGESAEGVSIVFSKGRAEMQLRLYAAADKTPARGVYVVLAPLDPAQRYRTDVPNCSTDRDGTCTLGGAPGDYALITFNPDRRPNLYNEQEAQRLIAAAPRVTLRPGKPASFELVLDGGH